MFDTTPTIETATTKLWMLTKAKMAKLGYHVGEAPANGPTLSTLSRVLHKVPVPPLYHLTATAALGIAARAKRRDNPIPPALLAALAETFAADAVAALNKARAVKNPPKKPGKKVYDRDKEVADAAYRVLVAEMLLRTYCDAEVHRVAAQADGPTYWVGDVTPKFSSGVANTLRAQQGAEGVGISDLLFDRQSTSRHGESGVASTLAARDSSGGPLDLVVTVTPDVTLYAQNTRDELRAVGGDGSRASSLCGPSGKQYDMVVGAFSAGQGSAAKGIGFDAEVSPTLKAAPSGTNQVPTIIEADTAKGVPLDVSGMDVDQLAAAAQAHVARVGRRYLLRRLTPMECMRLQAFEPDHCMVPYQGKRPRKLSDAKAAELIAFHAAEGRHYTKEQLESFVSDSDQYACAGNSIAVVCLDFLMGNVAKVAAPLLAKPANDNAADWPARIEAAKRGGLDTVDAIATCLAEDRARHEGRGDEEIVMAGLGCSRDEARSVAELLLEVA
ncbi:hypothetical protein [Magnetospirillum sp. SS-4]|uniref:hypothetical protein n=1 Tax=Magnetospirillum sp. SS-4 TaxID=2681465 RepID=UPI0013838287|nr:hypothetical protein [Magnetospirillum sp. SS-4]CAA7619028.1 hypothetical protein MTBSS4_230022 [Magnetospirillum sp. SS-4]